MCLKTLFLLKTDDFFGEKSVVETLKQKGYQVERQIALWCSQCTSSNN